MAAVKLRIHAVAACKIPHVSGDKDDALDVAVAVVAEDSLGE